MKTKHSSQREAIFAVLQSTKLHPSAQWVYNEVKKGSNERQAIPNISLGTVYRNLSLFREEGRAASLGEIAGEERFDAITAPHPHFVCEKCGAVEDLSVADADLFSRELDMLVAARAKNGGKIDAGRTMFYGLCKRCAE
jgi:Fur family peroxide stress response transcriptional regulator